MPKKYDLIIFDCDGTLVDSERAIAEAYASALNDLGYTNFSADYLLEHSLGKGITQVVNILHNAYGKDFDAQQFMRVGIDYATKRMKTSTVPMPGAKEFLEELRIEQARCVASNGEYQNVKEALKATGLYGFFKEDEIFTYEVVGRPKPAPDLFLYAAKHFGADPSKCIVIEDSKAGIMAANAAMMDVLRISARGPHDPEVAALETIGVIKDIREIKDHILL